jgi:glycosyltransferase involved in cell wall biosynthesis
LVVPEELRAARAFLSVLHSSIASPVERPSCDTGNAGPGLSIVSSSGPGALGGLATVVRELAGEFASTQPVQIISRFAGGGPSGVSYVARERRRSLQYSGVPLEVVTPSRAATPGLHLVKHLIHRKPLQGSAARYFSLAYRRSIARAVPSNTQVVHLVGAGWELLGFPALQVARERGAIFSVWPAIHPGAWGDSALDARLYTEADVVFAQSKLERASLIDLGVHPSQIVVTGCGPGSGHVGDGARFKARHGLEQSQTVLFIGRKQRYKGYHALCEAMSLVVQRFPRCRLISIGADGELPYPAVEGGVIDLGRCSEDEKADALAACDVFCLPSREESFGIVYVEAWAAGKPVLGGPAPAVRELVRDGVDGFCCSQDPAAIAAKLVMLLSGEELRTALGEAGRQRQQQQFTWPAVAATHRAAFTDALARRAALRSV